MVDYPVLSEENQNKSQDVSNLGKKEVQPFLTNQKKIGFIVIISICLLIVVAIGLWIVRNDLVQPQQASPVKIHNVGILSSIDYFYPIAESFREQMKTLGYIEGENISYDIVRVDQPIGNQTAVQKFIDEKVDLILVFPTEATIETQQLAKDRNIPVISTVLFTETPGLVQNLTHPGGNMTGVRAPIVEVAARRLEILHQIDPGAKHILIPYLKGYPTVVPSLEKITPIAASYGVTLLPMAVSTPQELADQLNALQFSSDSKVDAILELPEPLSIVNAYADVLYPFAVQHSLPIVGTEVLDIDQGPVVGLDPSTQEYGMLAATMADEIFRGVSPGEIPILTPDSQLSVNYRLMQKMGLSADEGLLSRANKIVH